MKGLVKEQFHSHSLRSTWWLQGAQSTVSSTTHLFSAHLCFLLGKMSAQFIGPCVAVFNTG